MSPYNAFIFDLNGTMINDMSYHELAWYDILVNELHAGLTREGVKAQMYGKNEEMMVRVFGPGKFSQEEVNAIVARKEARYKKEFLPHLELINGLGPLLAKAKTDNIRMEGKQYIYTNRGFGFIGYPGRIGILPEITVFELFRGEGIEGEPLQS